MTPLMNTRGQLEAYCCKQEEFRIQFQQLHFVLDAIPYDKA